MTFLKNVTLRGIAPAGRDDRKVTVVGFYNSSTDTPRAVVVNSDGEFETASIFNLILEPKKND